MTIDPDILAIRRRRRQQGRCVACGKHAGIAVLCAGCRTTLVYCPRCEELRARPPGARHTCSSLYCPPCNTQRSREYHGWHGTVAEYQERRRARRRELLPHVIRRYRAGENLSATARALGLTREEIDHMISQARTRGEWPAELRRRKRKGRSLRQEG